MNIFPLVVFDFGASRISIICTHAPKQGFKVLLMFEFSDKNWQFWTLVHTYNIVIEIFKIQILLEPHNECFCQNIYRHIAYFCIQKAVSV